jgi:hypothetical protein
MKKILKVLFTVLLATSVVSCLSTNVDDGDPNVAKGISAWNSRSPEAATAYWSDIEDPAEQKKFLNYVTLFNAGQAALDGTEGVKNSGKLISASNTALSKFKALDSRLEIPADVKEKGIDLSVVCIDHLLAAEKIKDATDMYNLSVKVYGKSDKFSGVVKEIDVCRSIEAKRQSVLDEIEKINSIEDVDERIFALTELKDKLSGYDAEVTKIVNASEVGKTAGVSAFQKRFKKLNQDVAIQLEGAYRDKIYDFKERIGEEFARQMVAKENGNYKLEEILNHYQTIEKNINDIYAELLDFADKHKQNVDQDVIDEVTFQKNDLSAKIAQINKEIAREKEIASRGKTVMPLMIGLFNPAPGSSAESKKSRPAKFSATNQKKAEYWWGMVSIPKGEMNDLVITLKDNRNVRVFNENTKSGKLIEKNNLKDLVSRSSRVGNSWPVLNAGAQLKGSNYFFEIDKGKTEEYSGEVVVYSSFITRMR